MKSATIEKKSHRKKFGKSEFSKIIDAYYKMDEDVFYIRFENGTVHTILNKEIKNQNRIKTNSPVTNVTIDLELGVGFFVNYEDGSKAEASWEMVLEEY